MSARAGRSWFATASAILSACVIASPLAAQETPAPPLAPTIVKSATDNDNRMTVPVTIDGSGPYAFVVDTGADRTVVSRELAGRLQLKPSDPVTMHSMTGVGSVDTVLIQRLGVGGGTHGDIRAPALAEEHIGASGLLGIDSLKGRRVVMDFRKRTFTISEGRKVERSDPDTIVVTARSRYGQLILVDSDIDGTPITVIVDSGATVSVGNSALRQMLARKHKTMKFTPTLMTDVTGAQLTADFALVDDLRIGGFRINDVGVAFVDAHPFTKLGLLKRPAMLLGMDTLRTFRRVSVDFAARKVMFLLPDEV